MPRTFKPTLDVQPVSQPQKIKYLLENMGDAVELRPIYQRDIKWSLENMCDLIMSVMCCGFIPGILLYKLQDGDERAKSSLEQECVDGQHRFFTLLHYFYSTPVVLPGKSPFLITLRYEEDGHTTHVFYRKTSDTEAWIAANRDKKMDYMTEDEKRHFNNFPLDIREINSPLSLDQRRHLFLSLQKGVAVRGSDLYKNKTDVNLIKFISEEMRLEAATKKLMTEHLSMNPKQYWLHWLVRAYTMQQAKGAEERVKAYITTDSQISQMMKNSHPLLLSTPETEAAFKGGLDRFFKFLGSLPTGVKVTPTQFYVIFLHLLDAEEGREDILRSHMDLWSTAGMTSKMRKMWENRGYDEAQRVAAFQCALEEIERIIVPAPEVSARKKIPKKIRDKVWNNAFDDDTVGECACCKDVIDFENWECAHILAHKCGGKDEEANLVPTCRSCNRSMGTENLEVFRARCYPE